MKKFSHEQLKRKIQRDSLELCVTEGFDASDIEDIEISEAWRKASDAFMQLDNILEKKLGEDYQWPDDF